MTRPHKTLLLVALGSLLLMAATTVVNLATQVSGILATANGGTGQNSTATFPSSGTVATTASVPAGGSCTNQVVTAHTNGSAPTCANVSNAMLASGSYTKGEYFASCTGTVTSSVTNFVFAGFGGKVNLCADATGTTASGGMKMPTAGTVKNLTVNLSAAGKSGDKITLLKNGSSTGAPTCTFGTGTSCTDLATALAVAAGDVITISVVSGTSDGAANISVNFELWN